MLVCSSAYNLTKPSRLRPLFLRLDQSAIFLLIAGSYTPFTTQRLEGGWVDRHDGADLGHGAARVAGKLLLPRLSEKFWVGCYIAISWVALIALKPLIDNTHWFAMALLIGGGLLYMAGVPLFLHPRCPTGAPCGTASWWPRRRRIRRRCGPEWCWPPEPGWTG
jgi:hemolysin III